jgi:Ras-related protein Rab-1A
MNPIPEEDETSIITEESIRIEKKQSKNNIEDNKDSYANNNNENSLIQSENNINKSNITEEINNNINININQKKNHLNNNKKNIKKVIKKVEYKIILLGEFNVGKSSIIAQFVDNNYQKIEKQKNCKNKCKSIAVDSETVAKLELYDSSGEEKFNKTLPNQFYKDAYGAIIVYDVTNKESFNKIKFWINEIISKCPSDTIILIIGNKTDIKERVVSYDEGNLLAQKYQIEYFETSAKTGNNITLIFEKLLFEIIKKQNQNETKSFINERSSQRKSVKLTEKKNNLNRENNNENNNPKSKCKC